MNAIPITMDFSILRNTQTNHAIVQGIRSILFVSRGSTKHEETRRHDKIEVVMLDIT